MKRLLIPAIMLLFLPVILFARDYTVVSFSTENAGKIDFNHPVHLKALGSNCTICHNTLFAIGKKAAPVTMKEMEQGKSCGSCHNSQRAFALTQCTRCHVTKEVPVDIPNFGAVIFSHSFHLGLGAYGCEDCHNALFRARTDNPNVTMKEMEKGISCGACHDGKTAFSVKGDCTKCHKVRDIPYAADATFSHDYHLGLGAYSCNDCHGKLFVAGPASRRYTMQEMETQQSCGGCHNGNTAFSVKGDCGKCHKNVAEVTFDKSDAFFSHKVHTKILECGSCHSGIFIGGAASKRFTMADMEKGHSCGVCHEDKTVFGARGNCEKCHVKTRDVPFKTDVAGTVAFSHGIHKQLYGCGDCHNGIFSAGAARKKFTMADMAKGKSCGACHDGKSAFSVTAAASCGTCHPLRDVVMAYDARFPHVKHLEAQSCGDCHNDLFLPGSGNKRWTMAQMEKGNSCGACHDGKNAFTVQGECGKCHKSTVEVALSVPQTGVTRFSHTFHTGLHACNDCHNAIFGAGASAKRHPMADMEKGESCGACHDGKGAFSVKENCTKCHPVKEISFKESGARFSHTFHLNAYGCTDCHDALFKPAAENRRGTMAEMEQGKSCGACHDGKSAFGVAEHCEKCHPVTKGVKYEVPTANGSVLFSHKSHSAKGYGCIDCHSKIVLAGAGRRSYTMKEMEQGKSCGACHGFSMAFSVKDPNNCDKCHQRQLY
ncbi:MAG: cytochrome C [Desulfuromonadales bacterium]|nr:MAG: cytochrome C [Desulfuromonadales bacterium]